MTKEIKSHIYLYIFSTPLYHFLQVSSASSKSNLSETSNQKKNHLAQSQVFPTKAHDSDTHSTEQLELSITGQFDLSTTQSEISLIKQSSSPQEKHGKLSFPKSENCSLAKPSSVTPDSLCQTAQDSPDDQIIISSESTPAPPRFGSPQLGQLVSDLEGMKLDFRPEAVGPPQNPEFSDESSEDDQISKFEDTLRVNMSSVIQMAEDNNHTNVAVTEPAHFQTSVQDELKIVTVSPDLPKTSETSIPSSPGSCKDSPVSPTESLTVPESPHRFCEVMEPSLNSSFPLDIFQSGKYDINAIEPFSPVSLLEVDAKTQSEIPEEHLANLHEEDSTTDILQSKEELESAESSRSSRGVTEEISTKYTHNQLQYFREATSVEVTQSEDLSSQSLSDLTPETVTSARHFSFEELMPYPSPGNLESSSDEDRPKANGQHSEDSLTVGSECFASLIKPKPEMTSSTSDEEYSIPPGYAETCSTTTIYNHMPPEYAKVVHSGTESPFFEYSDPEPYFDCKQAASDFSETEPDEPDPSVRSCGDQPHDHLSNPTVLEMVNRRVLLSSGSEDYEDAPYVHEPLHNIHEENEELLHYSETSDDEFTLCEASRPPAVCSAYDDTDKYLTRVR